MTSSTPNRSIVAVVVTALAAGTFALATGVASAAPTSVPTVAPTATNDGYGSGVRFKP